MPLPPPANKPLLLVFPLAHAVNYKRCLVVAHHLRALFNIRFLHSDSLAYLVYQQGFETFSNTAFILPSLNSNSNKVTQPDETSLELQFLEQVEMLETLQPSLVLGDGLLTLGMATEFTGVPFISLIRGYQSPYAINHHPFLETLSAQSLFQVLREKYGLQEKQTVQEELEGDLNWICDLPELFPQRELPHHYEVIGPLLERSKAPVTPQFIRLNSLKKTILIDIDTHDQTKALHLLNSPCFQQYNLVAETTHSHLKLAKEARALQLLNLEQTLPKIDLLLCNTERLAYRALLQGIPVLTIYEDNSLRHLAKALENWQIAAKWEVDDEGESHALLHYWTNHKQLDALRTIQYKIKTATAGTLQRMHHSISLHFPFLEKQAIPLL